MDPKKPCALFLLDWKPVFWSTREEYFCQLSKRLVERGIHPVLVISDEVESRVRERFEQAGARLIACSYHARLGEYRAVIQSVAREFRVLFAHARFFDYFTALFWICRMSGIRAVMFTEANSGEWTQSGLKAALLRLRTKFMCAPVVQFIAISEFIRERLELCGVARDKIAVVYNGVDVGSFQRDEAARAELREKVGTGAETIVMIFMSVLLKWKRPQIPLQVCAELARRGVDIELWIAGKGPLQAELEAEAKRLGIDKRVRWLGHQPDPHRWFAASDVFIHTAIGEAFGNVLVEALGCGVPVIASKSGATPELVEEDKTGKLVPVDRQEIEQLACAVNQVTGSRAKYAEFSQRAAAAAQHFSTQIAVDRTMEVYAKWLN
jgi:glycosyltransferase involved in cell wall biosynthesis